MIFANIMQDKEGRKKYWSKLFHKYRFVVMTDNAFEEKLSVKFSRLNVISFLGGLVFLFFFSTFHTHHLANTYPENHQLKYKKI